MKLSMLETMLEMKRSVISGFNPGSYSKDIQIDDKI
jgi:hypothetical protein